MNIQEHMRHNSTKYNFKNVYSDGNMDEIINGAGRRLSVGVGESVLFASVKTWLELVPVIQYCNFQH